MKSKSLHNIYLYAAVIILGLAIFEYWVYHSSLGSPATSCFFIVLFGIPCAVCGGSHAMMSLLHGQVLTAISFNILTTFIFISHIIISIILLYDLLFSSDQMIRLYNFILSKLERKNIRYGLALFLICCWIVNIYKYHPR